MLCKRYVNTLSYMGPWRGSLKRSIIKSSALYLFHYRRRILLLLSNSRYCAILYWDHDKDQISLCTLFCTYRHHEMVFQGGRWCGKIKSFLAHVSMSVKATFTTIPVVILSRQGNVRKQLTHGCPLPCYTGFIIVSCISTNGTNLGR